MRGASIASSLAGVSVIEASMGAFTSEGIISVGSM